MLVNCAEKCKKFSRHASACATVGRVSGAGPRPMREAIMVACEQGYLCDVCGGDVEAITESDLYLRYVLGEVSPILLPTQRERHIRCNPALAQYIVDPAFAAVKCDGIFGTELLDPE